MPKRKRHNYKNLKIWQLSIGLADEVYDIVKTFPQHERYDLSSQMNRCSISIPSNIAEGSARTDKSFFSFFRPIFRLFFLVRNTGYNCF